MHSLIVGVGALGGVIGARLRARGVAVSFATRDARAAALLKDEGLHVTGTGGAVHVAIEDVRALGDGFTSRFDLVVLATKADDALAAAPRCVELLAPEGALLPMQNGAVARVLADQHGDVVLGGLSNLGATMVRLGMYEQRNAGHLLIGELAGGESGRARRVAAFLGNGVETRTTSNLTGAIWSKLLLNCSVTTLGAIAGTTMRRYVERPEGRELFDATYDETLAVALASGARPERMLVEPTPPVSRRGREAWLEEILAAYGDLQASLLQDLERGRPTEIEFINGYVARRGRELGVPTRFNTAIAEIVRAISRGELEPSTENLGKALRG